MRLRWRVVLLLLALGPALLHAQSAIVRSGHLTPDTAALLKQAMVTLPPPPAWDPKTPATTCTIDDIKAEFAKVTDTPPQVNFVRTQFLRPDPTWLARYKAWFRSLEKPLRLRFEDQLFDCDNYANCFVAFADLLTLQSRETRGAFCVGWAAVFYQRPFAGIRSGPHAVAIAATTQGLYIIEPQDGTMVPLREFPNRHTIEAVYF